MTRRLRMAAFLAGAVVLQIGPVHVQVLNRQAPMLMGWRMFDGKALDVCEVRFEERRDGRAVGSFTVADRMPLEAHRVSAEWRRISSVETAVSFGKRQCPTLEPNTDLRLFARCADRRQGWKTVATGEENLCSR